MTLHCDVTLRRPGFALQVDLHLEGARFVALVGPSGAGKSTLLRVLAGLVTDAEGHIRFHDSVWQDKQQVLPAHLRPIGFVFQDAALFSHLDVAGNLRFGMTRVPESARRLAFDDVVSLLGITPLLSRRTATLSGGERQRVAIGRALLTSPQVLLFDEPLASLDGESRAQIMPYLAAVQRTLKLPTLYVSHTLSEVMRLADDVIYLDSGAVRAHGSLNSVLCDEKLPLAHAEDAGVALDLEVVGFEPAFHLMQLALGQARISVSEQPVKQGERVRVLLRARDLGVSNVAPEQTSILNVLPARVRDVHQERDPAHRLVRLDAGGHLLLARVTHKAVHQLGLVPGADVYAHVKSVALAEG